MTSTARFAAGAVRYRLSPLAVAISLSIQAIFWAVAPVRANAAPTDKTHNEALRIEVPAEVLERPLPLRQGIGNSHEVVTTRFPEAQAFFDQGLNYLEGYVWIEAARSFNQALRLDPKPAMASVGLSRASSGLGDGAAAQRHIQKARSLARKASPRERRRVEIREKQLEAMKNIKDTQKFAAYKKAIDDALTAECDPGLWLLRGNAEEPDASGRGQYGTETSAIYYRHVLGVAPGYASAHHFLTHTYEGLGQTDSALVHGEAYARLAPAIPHAAHMWGHALRKAGRIREAIAHFERADSLERAYFAAEKIDPKYDWHHAHNVGLLATVKREAASRSAAPAPVDSSSATAGDKTPGRASM